MDQRNIRFGTRRRQDDPGFSESYLKERAESQSKRRLQALETQRLQRHKVFSLTRSELDESLDNLDLDNSDDDDEQAEVEVEENEEQFRDAEEEDYKDGTMQQDQHVVNKSKNKARIRKANKIKSRFARFANKIMYAEYLDMSEGLPQDIATDWILLAPVPRGRRCLALTFSTYKQSKRKTSTNTLILSRGSGKPISRYKTELPGDCILDCILDSETGVLWILDIINWVGHSMSDGEAEFRFFWRDSKLSELPEQETPRKPTNSQRQLFVAGVPSASPIQSTSAQINIMLSESLKERTNVHQNIPCVSDGALLYVKNAVYESGLSCLAGWIPRETGALNEFCQKLIGHESISSSSVAPMET